MSINFYFVVGGCGFILRKFNFDVLMIVVFSLIVVRIGICVIVCGNMCCYISIVGVRLRVCVCLI